MSALQSVNESSRDNSVLASLAFDENGYLCDSGYWDDHVADQLAEQEGIAPLQPAHWRVIRFVRDRYLRLGAIPPMRHICRSSALSRREVKRLFGGCLQVWRIAGLPNPGEEARAYLS